MHDLKKYKLWLSARAREDWESFVSNAKEFSEVTSIPCQCELPVLVSTAITASHACKQQHPRPLSDETIKLMEKETTVLKKVISYIKNHTCIL